MRPVIKHPLRFTFLALALFGCDKKVESSPTPLTAGPVSEAVPLPAPAVTPTVPAHMSEHFLKSAELKKAVIDGKLGDFKASAVWMAEHELAAEYPENWKGGVDAMKDSARLGRDAATLEAAAASLGATGAACAACHEKLGGPKVTPVGEPPAEGSGNPPHMLRHQWAMDLMWLGLVTPSDEAWVKGAEVMSDAPLTPGTISPTQTVTRAVAKLADETHAAAAAARNVEKSARGKVYGELLLSCTGCHQALAKK
ncbi:MAG: hypothetical protein Q8L48_43230 [Archangium sp.]|nr:hypothetical protein [Archangium sp.]